MLPYLAISICLIVAIILLTGWHFHVKFHQPAVLALICLLFLICSLGPRLADLRLFAHANPGHPVLRFLLLPVFVLSGAFAPLAQLPRFIRYTAEIFPLTHFCRAFRLVNLYRAGFSYLTLDLAVLFFGALITFVGAALLLRRIEQ